MEAPTPLAKGHGRSQSNLLLSAEHSYSSDIGEDGVHIIFDHRVRRRLQ